MFTFKQGIHLTYHKELTEKLPIEELPPPYQVILPLHQHTGAICEPLVKVGEEVFAGQKIGDSEKLISAPVHASIAGKVTKIDKLNHPSGAKVLSIVIESQAVSPEGVRSPLDRQFSALSRYESLENLMPEEIRKIVHEAGVVGLGGAAFPTQVKLTPPEEKKIDTVIINGCECEPYITADYRLMLERTEEIIFGAQVMASAVGAKRIIIGVEDNKKYAAEKLLITNYKIQNTKYKIQVVLLKTKYPQGGEKQLIYSLLKREVPSGGLPFEVGVIVSNVGTAVAITEAVKFGQPLIKRVITVTGSGIKNPKNLWVRLGTTFEKIIQFCGGLTEEAAKILMGGPMMGITQSTTDFPIIKNTNCILVLTKEEAQEEKIYPCINCARCVNHCPMYLLPTRLYFLTEQERYADFEQGGGRDCIECGCCSYVCPSRIPLVQWFKLGKIKLQAIK